MKEMKELSSTVFGLLIAYVLPGLTACYGLSLWSPRLNGVVEALVSGQASATILVCTILASITVGLQLTAVRWLIFERWICRKHSFTGEEFQQLHVEGKFAAFRIAIDEQYRYHQFWGGMSIAQLLFFARWISTHWFPSYQNFVTIVLVMPTVELLTLFAAKVAYERYIERSKWILKKET
jgi:hypothetical protein